MKPLSLFLFTLSLTAQAQERSANSEIETPIREENGQILRLSRADARKYCAGLDKKLPSFKDFVDYAVSYGARGLVAKDEGILFSWTYVTESATYIFDVEGYRWPEPSAPDDARSTYWIDDNADQKVYKNTTTDRNGNVHYIYDSFTFNRVKGFGPFFIENSKNKKEFVCISKL